MTRRNPSEWLNLERRCEMSKSKKKKYGETRKCQHFKMDTMTIGVSLVKGFKTLKNKDECHLSKPKEITHVTRCDINDIT